MLIFRRRCLGLGSPDTAQGDGADPEITCDIVLLDVFLRVRKLIEELPIAGGGIVQDKGLFPLLGSHQSLIQNVFVNDSPGRMGSRQLHLVRVCKNRHFCIFERLYRKGRRLAFGQVPHFHQGSDMPASSGRQGMDLLQSPDHGLDFLPHDAIVTDGYSRNNPRQRFLILT
jgi:hypothetical protein